MKQLQKVLPILLLLALTGCVNLEGYQTKSAEQVAKATNVYCDETDRTAAIINMEADAWRIDFRDEINGILAAEGKGRSIGPVNCGE